MTSASAFVKTEIWNITWQQLKNLQKLKISQKVEGFRYNVQTGYSLPAVLGFFQDYCIDLSMTETTTTAFYARLC